MSLWAGPVDTYTAESTHAVVPFLQAFLHCDSPGFWHDNSCSWLQDRVRELESEIEWVRAERQDAQQAAQREQKQAQARIKEGEDAAARAKAARRWPSPATCLHTLCAQCWLKPQWIHAVLLCHALQPRPALLSTSDLLACQSCSSFRVCCRFLPGYLCKSMKSALRVLSACLGMR